MYTDLFKSLITFNLIIYENNFPLLSIFAILLFDEHELKLLPERLDFTNL